MPESINPQAMFPEQVARVLTACGSQPVTVKMIQADIDDGDENIICLHPDNKTIASEDEIIRDHELMKRTHTYGILRADGRRGDEVSAALHCHQDRKHGKKRKGGEHTMTYELRPGESMIWRWSNVHKWYGTDRYGSWKRVGAQVANGQLVYEPRFEDNAHRKHLGTLEGGRFRARADGGMDYQPAKAKQKQDRALWRRPVRRPFFRNHKLLLHFGGKI